MFRPLYDKVLQWAGHRHALWVMGVVSFLESSIFPIPPDVMLVPMVLANRQRAFTIAFICTVSSVLGGLLGYAIGYWLLETAGAWLIRTYGLQGALEEFRRGFEHYGIWIILVKGLTPIPYKLVTIASGLAAFSFPMFIAASALTRGARFFLVAFIIKKFGPALLPVVERRLALFAGILIALVVIGLTASHFIGGGGHGGACAA